MLWLSQQEVPTALALLATKAGVSTLAMIDEMTPKDREDTVECLQPGMRKRVRDGFALRYGNPGILFLSPHIQFKFVSVSPLLSHYACIRLYTYPSLLLAEGMKKWLVDVGFTDLELIEKYVQGLTSQGYTESSQMDCISHETLERAGVVLGRHRDMILAAATRGTPHITLHYIAI